MARVKMAKEKKQRGMIPGKRGPHRTAADRFALENKTADRVVVVNTDVNPNQDQISRFNASRAAAVSEKKTVSSYSARTQKANHDLQRLIRDIGEEVVDPATGWTRTVAVVRRLYADAMMGKTAAQALLFERGWGKPLVPVRVDVKTELKNIVIETGLTSEDIERDPVLRTLFETVEGDYREITGLEPAAGGEGYLGSAGQVELVRPEPLSAGNSDQLLRSPTVVEDGGRS